MRRNAFLADFLARPKLDALREFVVDLVAAKDRATIVECHRVIMVISPTTSVPDLVEAMILAQPEYADLFLEKLEEELKLPDALLSASARSKLNGWAMSQVLLEATHAAWRLSEEKMYFEPFDRDLAYLWAKIVLLFPDSPDMPEDRVAGEFRNTFAQYVRSVLGCGPEREAVLRLQLGIFYHYVESFLEKNPQHTLSGVGKVFLEKFAYQGFGLVRYPIQLSFLSGAFKAPAEKT